MSEKNSIIKKENKNTPDVNILVDKKLEFFKDVIQKTIIHVQKNKILDILGISDISTCIDRLNEINKKIKEVSNENTTTTDAVINSLQFINNELSGLLKNYGTESLEDLLLICFGNNNKITTDEKEQQKFDLLKKYFHPTSYKVVVKKDEKTKKGEEPYDDKFKNLDCTDVVSNYKQLHIKVYGIKLFVHSTFLKKSLIIYGIVDDVIVDFLNNKYIFNKQKNIILNKPDEDEFKGNAFDMYISSLLLKDYLIYDSHTEIYNKFVGLLTQNNNIHQKQISQLVKEFISDDMYNKRNTLIILLIKSSKYENQYLAYLYMTFSLMIQMEV